LTRTNYRGLSWEKRRRLSEKMTVLKRKARYYENRRLGLNTSLDNKTFNKKLKAIQEKEQAVADEIWDLRTIIWNLQMDGIGKVKALR